jgi:hypothetical protein
MNDTDPSLGNTIALMLLTIAVYSKCNGVYSHVGQGQ